MCYTCGAEVLRSTHAIACLAQCKSFRINGEDLDCKTIATHPRGLDSALVGIVSRRACPHDGHVSRENSSKPAKLHAEH